MVRLFVQCMGIAGLAIFLTAIPANADHDKTDVVTTDDGGTYVGAIKSIKYATLNLDTDPAGLLGIEWEHITGITSKFEYQIELSGGDLRFGSLGHASKPGRLKIVDNNESTEVDLSEVVAIWPIEHGFWQRLDGSVNFGLTYTQANDAIQYNLSGDASYRSRKDYAQLSAQSIFSSQQGGDSTNQHNLKLALSQLGKKKWGAFELGQLQSNPDQGYDLRLIIGGGATNFLVEESAKLLMLSLGAVYNRESVTDSSDVDGSLEALAGLAYRRFDDGSNSPNVQIDLQTFTNVTGDSRFRASFNFQIGWNIVGNLTVNFQVIDNYDTDPPGTGSEKNDMSVVTSIGYTF